MNDKELLKELTSLKDRINKIEKSLPSKNQLFGKPSSELGSIKSETVIATLGTLKIRYGNKYVTVFKDGKLTNSGEQSNFIFKSDQVGTDDGIYVIEGEQGDFSVSIVLNGLVYDISIGDTTYVSFIETLETTSEQKETALRNIGILYSSLTEFQDNKVNDGIIYVADEGKLYLVRNGIASEFTIDFPEEFDSLTINSLKTDNIKLGNIIISSSGITLADSFKIGVATFTSNSLTVPTLNCSTINGNYFSITQQDGESTLTIDNIVVTNQSLSQIPKYTLYDVIQTIEEEEDRLYIINYSLGNKYLENDILLILYWNKSSIEKYYIKYDGDGNMSYYEDTEDLDWDDDGKLYLIDGSGNVVVYENDGSLIPKYSTIELSNYTTEDILFKCLGNSTFQILSELSTDLLDEPELLRGSFAYLIKRGDNSIPLTSVSGEIQVFVLEIDENGGKILNKTPIVTLNSTSETCGLTLNKPAGLQYATFAHYSEDSELIPLDADGNVLATIKWVKDYHGDTIPKGSIMAYHGDTIPKGWILCDGLNGTPNLIGKFIIGGDDEQEGDEISLYPISSSSELNPITLKIEPKYYSLVFIMKME